MDEPSQQSGPRHTPTAGRKTCPVCGSRDLFTLLAFDTPVLCNVLFPEKMSARATESGRLTLTHCRSCSHVFNSTYEEHKVRYTPNYNSSLEHSPRFRTFADALAQRLTKSYNLSGKTIVEIGCGKGEFLNRICSLAEAQGVGFDTSFEGRRTPNASGVRFVQDYFDESYVDLRPDLMVCRHVLEHISEPIKFLSALCKHPSIGPETVFYFETPNSLYTFRDHGIWDLIYEHVSYFTEASLCMAFELAGFEVLNAGTSFSEQYVHVEARPRPPQRSTTASSRADVMSLVNSFNAVYHAKVSRWAHYIAAHAPEKTVVWGAGSKGITFVNVVPGCERLSALVDLNAHKQGRFAPLHGTLVVGPDDLSKQKPRSIIIMNPVYSDEIARAAAAFAPTAELVLA